LQHFSITYDNLDEIKIYWKQIQKIQLKSCKIRYCSSWLPDICQDSRKLPYSNIDLTAKSTYNYRNKGHRVSDYNPISFKYLTGWGDVELAAPQVSTNASIEEIFKMLKKYSPKDKQYFKDQWRKVYGFYANALLEEEDAGLALSDEYLKKVERELD